MSSEDGRRAYDAAQRAAATSAGATAVEVALASAITARYAWPMPDDRKQLDEDYAAAMAAVYEAHPGDPDVATLFADALMLLQPWEYWTPEREPKGRVMEAIAALEGALAEDPDHAGACHFLIHATEAAEPERAEAAADRLSARVPGAGHLLHMPSHIYVHVGRYPDASDVNQAAIVADEEYLARAPDAGNYFGYHAHNVHMLAFAAMMEGREDIALAAAIRLDENTPEQVIKDDLAWMDGLMATKLHVLVRFGHWEAILEEPEPPSYRLLSRAQRHYARGVALSAMGRTQEARVEQAAFEELAPQVPEDWKVGANPSQDVLGLARHMLDGEILWREGQVEQAFAAMQAGVAIEDAMLYDEPPGWMQPVRHAYGALLMAADRPAEAEAVYLADLERNPGNGWSLLGLEQACRAQDKLAAADEAAAALAVAWARADVQPMSSCFCEPGAG